MDAPDCDPVLLDRTYRQFAVLNQLLAGWDGLFTRRILPAARSAVRGRGTARLLDVGCGGGDLTRRLALLAREEGLPLEITGIDPDPRALAHARSRAVPPTVRYLRADAEEVVRRGADFDVVVSNHVLHHLPTADVPRFLDVTGRAARRLVLHNDIRRTPLALAAFAGFSLPFRGSFIGEDGFRSIRRSFAPAELAALVPAGWRVEPRFGFHQLVVRDVEAGDG